MRSGSVLGETAHRPDPLPEGPWIMAQRWHDLLFAHWPLPPEQVRRAVPAPLELDGFEGAAWVGVIPFRMSGVRLRWTPGVPGLSRFPELNVRTYVRYQERPGVYFFSLDAGSRPAVAAARRWYRLPYYRARMEVQHDGDAVGYRSRRVHPGAAPAELNMTYRPIGDPVLPRPGSLDHWLVERYRLFTVHGGRVRAAEIHHPPWRLRPAMAKFRTNTMTEGLGLELSSGDPRLAYAEEQEVLIWAPVTPGA